MFQVSNCSFRLQSAELLTIFKSPFDFTHALIVVVAVFVTAAVAYATPAAPPITATTISATRAKRRAITVLTSVSPRITNTGRTPSRE
jgi:hypothetical protein